MTPQVTAGQTLTFRPVILDTAGAAQAEGSILATGATLSTKDAAGLAVQTIIGERITVTIDANMPVGGHPNVFIQITGPDGVKTTGKTWDAEVVAATPAPPAPAPAGWPPPNWADIAFVMV